VEAAGRVPAASKEQRIMRIARIGNWLQRRRARQTLQGFSDAELADIGIGRSQIETAVRGEPRRR